MQRNKSNKMKKYPLTSIVILNWNGWRDTIECLESLFRISYKYCNVVVVDNGSTDDSIEKIRGYCNGKIEIKSNFFKYNRRDKPIKIFEYTREESESSKNKKMIINKSFLNNEIILIKNEKNYGFAEGNNIAIRFSLSSLNPDYILLLNNDTVVDKFFLEEMIKLAESNECIGIVGPKIYYYDFNGRTDIINFAGADFSLWRANEKKRYGYKKPNKNSYSINRSVDKIEGACMLIKRAVLNKIGLLDSNYYCYFEETDYCIKAKRKGFICFYCASAKIWHKISSSAKKITGFHIYYMSRNMFWFTKKNADKIQYILFILYFFIWRFWFFIGVIIYQKQLGAFLSLIKGVRDGIKGM